MAEQEPQDTSATPDPATEVGPAGGYTPSQPYTIHGDAIADTAVTVDRPAPRGGPDPIALVAGLVALVLAVLAMTGTLDAVDPRWILAAGALLVGGTVLASTLRRRA